MKKKKIFFGKSGTVSSIEGWGFHRGYIGLSNETIKNFKKKAKWKKKIFYKKNKIFFSKKCPKKGSKMAIFWGSKNIFFQKKKKFFFFNKSKNRPFFGEKGSGNPN